MEARWVPCAWKGERWLRRTRSVSGGELLARRGISEIIEINAFPHVQMEPQPSKGWVAWSRNPGFPPTGRLDKPRFPPQADIGKFTFPRTSSTKQNSSKVQYDQQVQRSYKFKKPVFTPPPESHKAHWLTSQKLRKDCRPWLTLFNPNFSRLFNHGLRFSYQLLISTEHLFFQAHFQKYWVIFFKTAKKPLLGLRDSHGNSNPWRTCPSRCFFPINQKHVLLFILCGRHKRACGRVREGSVHELRVWPELHGSGQASGRRGEVPGAHQDLSHL